MFHFRAIQRPIDCTQSMPKCTGMVRKLECVKPEAEQSAGLPSFTTPADGTARKCFCDVVPEHKDSVIEKWPVPSRSAGLSSASKHHNRLALRPRLVRAVAGTSQIAVSMLLLASNWPGWQWLLCCQMLYLRRNGVGQSWLCQPPTYTGIAFSPATNSTGKEPRPGGAAAACANVFVGSGFTHQSQAVVAYPTCWFHNHHGMSS